MKRCLELQGQKKNLESQIRVELETWRTKARNGTPRDECRRNVVGLLSQLKASQLAQDELISKEKHRLDAFRNVVNEDTTERLKMRLEFFSQLNKEHDKFLYLFREDSQECKAICKKYSDVQIRYVTYLFVSWHRFLSHQRIESNWNFVFASSIQFIIRSVLNSNLNWGEPDSGLDQVKWLRGKIFKLFVIFQEKNWL